MVVAPITAHGADNLIGRPLNDVEKYYIERTLDLCEGNREEAAAMLGIGRIIERPWVVKGEIVARRIGTVVLAFDHRICDGGYASGFLNKITSLIENPLLAYGEL